MFLITSCRTKVFQASVANLVQGLSSQARISVQADGGGNLQSTGSVDFIREVRSEVKNEERRKQRSTDEVKVNSNVFKKGMSMKNLIINILEAAVFILLGLGVSLLK